MLPFSPSKSRLWQHSAFSLFYSSLLGVLIRLSVFIFLFLAILLLITSGGKNTYFFFLSLLSIFVLFELFYRFKITRVLPPTKVSEIKPESDLSDLVDFELARILLSRPIWNTTFNLLRSLTLDPKVNFFLYKASIRGETLGKFIDDKETANLQELLQLAASFSERDNCPYIDSLSLLAAIFAESPSLKALAFEEELKEVDLENILHWSRSVFQESYQAVPFWERSYRPIGLGFASMWMGGWTLETEKYTQDINGRMLQDSNFLVGREKEIQLAEQVLGRTTKRNLILLGEPGIGKSAIVYSLAAKSLRGELPENLKYKRFLELDLGSVMASAKEGEIEERVKNILIEVSHSGDVVIFIPQIENLAGGLENGKLDITGLLNQTLKNINLQIIGTSTRVAYHKFIEDKATFADDFEVIDVSEPGTDAAIKILEEATGKIESQTGVIISYSAVKKAVELSERYLIDRVLPGKAINLVDEAASAVALSGNRVLDGQDIEKVVTDKAKIPVNLAAGNEKDKLLKLEETLHARVVGQEDAIKAISEAVRRSRTLKRESKKPIGVFLFLGPTGVGKTETAKALAEVYYGSEDRIIRLDMSEFNQETAVYRLIGSPPGASEYKEGGQLTEAVRVDPFSLVLLDELEKAHPKVEEIFLAIFDEGRITDSSGRPISFTNTIIIATSNAGSEFIREEIQKQTPQSKLKQSLIDKLLKENIFKPEFINRFDDVIVYKPLSDVEVTSVVKFMLKNLTTRLAKQDLTVKVTPEVITFLAEKGYDNQFGARPLQRAIQDQVESKISQAILESKISRGSDVQVNLVNNEISIE